MIRVLTLSWNGKNLLQKLHAKLISNLEKTGMDYSWFIRSNGCKDGTIEEFSNLKNVYLQQINHNMFNFAQGVNSLAKFSNNIHSYNDQDYYLLLNNDIVFKDDNSLLNMINCFDNNVGAVGARLVYPGTNKIQHGGVIFSSRYNNMPWHYRAGEDVDEDSKKNREFQAVTGACLLTKANLFDLVNGLDEKFSWAFEDIAYCLSLKDKKIIYCGETEIEHGESVSLKKNPVNKMMMPTNVSHFRKNYQYQIDHDFYLKNKKYKLI